MKARYQQLIEELMQLHFGRLSEKDKRTYAAVESMKLGYGGISYISSVLGITRMSIYKGIRELTNEQLYEQIPAGKQRRVGGGRKKICASLCY